MNRLMLIFLGFLMLATLSAGVTYQNAQGLLNGHLSVLSVLFLGLSAVIFAFAMLVLGRVLYLTTPGRSRWGTVK